MRFLQLFLGKNQLKQTFLENQIKNLVSGLVAGSYVLVPI